MPRNVIFTRVPKEYQESYYCEDERAAQDESAASGSPQSLESSGDWKTGSSHVV